MIFFVAYILPFIYLALFSFLLQRNCFLRQNGFKPWFVVVFFLFKCLAGIINDYSSFLFSGDVVLYFNDGLALYHTLLHDPGNFMQMLKQMFSISDFGLFNSQSSFIRTVFEAIKFIHFVLNIFSFGNVYTNTILFNGLTCMAIFRCWIFLNNYSKTRVTGAILFLFPSAFFFSSNILKEGISVVILSILIPICYRVFQNARLKYLSVCFLLLLVLFFFKFIIAITFSVAIAGWFLMEKYPSKKPAVISFITIISITFFFAIKYVIPSLDLPAIVAHRQEEFIALKANSEIKVKQAEPTFPGFLKVLPSACNTVLFKPLPFEGGRRIYIFNSVEIFLFWAAVFFLFFFNRLRMDFAAIKPLYWALFFYAMANLLVIGFIVPNIGAIVRYRSIFLPWLAIFFWFLFNGNHWLEIVRKKTLSN